jgi:hypothetical protein
MATEPVNVIVTLALLVASWTSSSVAVSSTPNAVTVCDLTHFGADSEGLTFRVQGIYVTDLRHGAWLYDLKSDACSLKFGVKQSDVDGSVKRFDQAVVDALMHLGPGTRQLVDAEVVFHWVAVHPSQPRPGKRSPTGVLELRRVLQSATESPPIGQVPNPDKQS